ncbi:MAG: hypothetical protein H0T78_01760 [Longispora sp.]|nr:hypothetical protein [Longispora sp. (in: high G+C Gram-positive bacteria)]
MPYSHRDSYGPQTFVPIDAPDAELRRQAVAAAQEQYRVALVFTGVTTKVLPGRGPNVPTREFEYECWSDLSDPYRTFTRQRGSNVLEPNFSTEQRDTVEEGIIIRTGPRRTAALLGRDYDDRQREADGVPFNDLPDW